MFPLFICVFLNGIVAYLGVGEVVELCLSSWRNLAKGDTGFTAATFVVDTVLVTTWGKNPINYHTYIWTKKFIPFCVVVMVSSLDSASAFMDSTNLVDAENEY